MIFMFGAWALIMKLYYCHEYLITTRFKPDKLLTASFRCFSGYARKNGYDNEPDLGAWILCMF